MVVSEMEKNCGLPPFQTSYLMQIFFLLLVIPTERNEVKPSVNHSKQRISYSFVINIPKGLSKQFFWKSISTTIVDNSADFSSTKETQGRTTYTRYGDNSLITLIDYALKFNRVQLIRF